MSNHDLIVSYKNTEEHSFPLILVIGREPSNSSPFSMTTGPYDFDSAPKCAFWNTSYSSIAQPCGMSITDMKRICRQAQASPIAFTDASPVPIDNSDARKTDLRLEVSKDDIDAHINNIAEMHHILNRIGIVLLSGHRTLKGKVGKNFEYASTKFEELFNSLSIEHLSVPFMYGTNQAEIIRQINNNSSAHSKVNSAVEKFTQFSNTIPSHKAA